MIVDFLQGPLQIEIPLGVYRDVFKILYIGFFPVIYG